MTNKQAAELLTRAGLKISDVFDEIEDRSLESGSAVLDEVLAVLDEALDHVDEAIRQLNKS